MVYTVPCKDCSNIYVGETKRNLKTRITEHKYAVRTADQKNGIAVHVQKEDHRIDWENAMVKEVVLQYWKRRTVEALEIKTAAHTVNLDCALTLSPIWDTLSF